MTRSSWSANGLDISHLTAAQQAKFLGGGLYIPDGNRISSFNADMERLGVTGAAQWRPADNLLLTLDGLYGAFTTHRDELHLASRPLASGTASWAFDTPAGAPWPAIFQTPSVINDIAWDKNNYVTDIDVSNSTFGTEHRRELNENRFKQVALTGTWDPTDRITVDGHAGYEKSTYDTPYDDKLYLRAKGNIIADYGSDGQSASFQYPNSDLTNPANYAMDDFYYRSFFNGSQLFEGVLNLHYKANEVWTLQAGAAYHRFRNNGANYFYDGNVNGTNGEARGDSVADITDVFTNSVGSWLIGDYPKAFAKYDEYHRLGPKPNGVGGDLQDIEQVYDVTEGDPFRVRAGGLGHRALRQALPRQHRPAWLRHPHPQHRLDPGRQLRLSRHGGREGSIFGRAAGAERGARPDARGAAALRRLAET